VKRRFHKYQEPGSTTYPAPFAFSDGNYGFFIHLTKKLSRRTDLAQAPWQRDIVADQSAPIYRVRLVRSGATNVE